MSKAVCASLLTCVFLLLNLPASFASSDRVPKNVQQPTPYHQKNTIDHKDILDINEPIFSPEKPPYILYGFIAVILLLLLTILCWWLMKRKTSVSPISHTSPLSDAKRELSHALESINHSDPRSFVIQCGNILRVYLESSLAATKTSMTSAELIQLLHQTRAVFDASDETLRSALVEILQISDQVKFARYQPTTNQVELIGPSLQEFFRREDQDTLEVDV